MYLTDFYDCCRYSTDGSFEKKAVYGLLIFLAVVVVADNICFTLLLLPRRSLDFCKRWLRKIASNTICKFLVAELKRRMKPKSKKICHAIPDTISKVLSRITLVVA